MNPFQLLALAVGLSGSVSLQAASGAAAPKPASESTIKVVLTSEVRFDQLNPARGDQSPKAGTLWGDRKGTEPTGFLFRPVDGFKSPPHIHNVSYRGVVISGLVHNDDPNAASMWMPAGSFWTQPAGEVHITAATGSDTMAYIEIEKGPYLVHPSEEAFDNGERPVNVDKTNIVWLDAANIKWISQRGKKAAADGPKVAFLWGKPQDGQLNGTLVKLPAGFAGTLRSHGSTFGAVVIQGRPTHQVPGKTGLKTLEPGSYFSAQGRSAHQVTSATGGESILYVRTNGRFDILPAQPKK